MGAIVSQTDPLQTVQEHFFKIRFTAVFPSTHRSTRGSFPTIRFYEFHNFSTRDTGTVHLIHLRVISGFRREVDDNCAVLGYYAECSGNSLPTFRNNLSIPLSWVKNRRWIRQVVPKGREGITTTSCVIAQKSTVLIHLCLLIVTKFLKNTNYEIFYSLTSCYFSTLMSRFSFQSFASRQ